MKPRPNIPFSLLWEYDPKSFDFDRSYKVVIERIMERGTLHDWREMLGYYSLQQIKETIEWSAQLTERDKQFSRLFIQSDLLHVA